MRTTDPQQLSNRAAVQPQVRLVFDRLTRQITRVSKDAKPENVHRFRTNSRRVEVLAANLSPQNGNTRKLLKLLSKLRRKAGEVRDLDVQIAFLKELKIPDRQNHRALLLETLTGEQQKQSKKFARSLDRAHPESSTVVSARSLDSSRSATRADAAAAAAGSIRSATAVNPTKHGRN